MKAIILSVGTELVTGQCLDTNSAWLATALTRVGVGVIRHETVGDDEAHLCDAIRRAMQQAELVMLTGGLGPTLDDLTRPALATALDQPLEENAEALAQIVTFFARWQRPMADSNRVQAMIPKGCLPLLNPVGTAPGIAFESTTCRLFALPGVPREMKRMFAEQVLPIVAQKTGGARAMEARLLCYGISEAALGETLADLMVRGRNPSVGTTASAAILSVRIIAHGRDEAEATGLLAADVAEVRKRLGTFVFGEGEDTLQQAVGRLLKQIKQTLATAESCTGGMLGQLITEISGSSAYYLRGYVTYSNEAKLSLLGVDGGLIEAQGAVSEAVASALASGCRTKARSDYALSITGIAGPDGGSPPEKPVGLVFVGLADATGTNVRRYLFGEHLAREEIRDRACKSALNLLRMRLMGESKAGSCRRSR